MVMSSMLTLALRLALVLASGAGTSEPPAPTPTGTPDATPVAPETLAATGLYAADGSVAPSNRPFAPQYPLWTDGAAKARWVHLPEGAAIDVTDVDAWRFPVGTKIWKEFAFGGRAVETRYLWLATEDGWVYATYVWNADGTAATLAPDRGVRDVVEVAPGKHHSVPGRSDCLACHASAPSPVLGFSALQLSDDRDPGAPHAERTVEGGVTLRTLVEGGHLSPPRPELVTDPPRIRTVDPVARSAMGYLSGNCGGCHNRTGSLSRLGLVLLHDVGADPSSAEPALATALDASGRYAIPEVGWELSRLLAPGDPSRSAIAHRMGSRRPSSQMPPLGTVIADEEALALITRWIETLGATPLP